MTAELDEDLDNQDATEWPDIVKTAAQRGRAKLSKYYAKTDDERGFLFNCATVLDPTTKLSLYEEEGWEVQDNKDTNSAPQSDSLSYEVEDIFELQAPIEDVPQIGESGELDELVEEVSPLQLTADGENKFWLYEYCRLSGQHDFALHSSESTTSITYNLKNQHKLEEFGYTTMALNPFDMAKGATSSISYLGGRRLMFNDSQFKKEFIDSVIDLDFTF
ncbi:transposase-like protein [Stemphylium lycopersici]|nr:transposase-like protein [Stemphylium lycopersici]